MTARELHPIAFETAAEFDQRQRAHDVAVDELIAAATAAAGYLMTLAAVGLVVLVAAGIPAVWLLWSAML